MRVQFSGMITVQAPRVGGSVLMVASGEHRVCVFADTTRVFDRSAEYVFDGLAAVFEGLPVLVCDGRGIMRRVS